MRAADRISYPGRCRSRSAVAACSHGEADLKADRTQANMSISFNSLRRSLARMLDPPPPEPEPEAGEEADDSRYNTPLALLRADLARRYIRGVGIEFGALDFPLPVPAEATVTYADFEPVERVKQLFSVSENVATPHIVSDLESMRGIAPASQDFVIANHVLEHVEDPFKALRSVSHVLRP